MDASNSSTRLRRLWLAMFLVVAAAGAGIWVWSSQPRTELERRRAAEDLVAGVHASVTVTSSSLAVTSAIADFGVSGGIHLVRVRILDELVLDVRLAADTEVVLATPPRICVVGPFSAPDDAGLSDPCWGAPDLEDAIAAHMPADADGHSLLVAGSPMDVAATLQRGDVGCDYPPGEWQLEVTLNPIIDGLPTGTIDVLPALFTVPLETAGPLPLLGVRETRYCGLASGVYRNQGEPPVASP
ncbi:MAG: hypothetical protein ABI555_10015 [Chloroflexota bacterium]